MPPWAGTSCSRANTSSGVPTTYWGEAFRSSTDVACTPGVECWPGVWNDAYVCASYSTYFPISAQARSGSSATCTKVGPTGCNTKPPSKPILRASSKYASRHDGVGVHREHREPQPRGPAGGRGHSPADEQHPARIGDRLGRHPHVTTAPFERLPRQRVEHGLHVLFEDAPARRVLEAGHLELLDPVARAEHDPGPARECVVEHRDLLGDADRVVQRQDRGAHHEPGAGGTREHRRGHRERRRQPAVVDAVVLREHERVEPVLVGPRELLERRRVDLLRRLGRERRGPEVVPHREERHGKRFRQRTRSVRADELRADLGAERRDLVAVLARIAGEEANLEMGDADRAEASVRELGDAIGRAVHHALRAGPTSARRRARPGDSRSPAPRRAARGRVRAGSSSMSAGSWSSGCRLRDPAVGHRRDAAQRGPPEPPIQIGGCGCCTGRGRCPTSPVDSGPVHSSVSAAAMIDSARSVVSPRPLNGDAERVELAFDVTGADADDRAPVRERVEGGERLRGGERRLVRGDEHVRHQPRARRCRAAR